MSSRFRTSWLLVTMLVLGLFAAQAVAQTIVTGDVVGTVTDQSNAVVPNATVTLTSADTGSSESAKTSSTGLFRFSLLKPGNYKIVAEQSGFRKTSASVAVAIGSVTTANLQLQIGQGSETVEVTGAAPLLQTENANIETSLNANAVDLMPNSGNDLTNGSVPELKQLWRQQPPAGQERNSGSGSREQWLHRAVWTPGWRAD
jgi:hypothetical protein